MSIHDIVHDIYPSFQGDDLVVKTQKERHCIIMTRRVALPIAFSSKTYDKHPHACGHKIVPTLAHRHPKHTADRCSTFSILFLTAIPQKKACGVPPASSTCVCVGECAWGCVRVCVCQGTDAALSCGHYANERWRCWDLKAVAQLSQADDTLTPQHLHLSCHNTLQLPAHTQQSQRQTYTKQVSRHVHVCS